MQREFGMNLMSWGTKEPCRVREVGSCDEFRRSIPDRSIEPCLMMISIGNNQSKAEATTEPCGDG